MATRSQHTRKEPDKFPITSNGNLFKDSEERVKKEKRFFHNMTYKSKISIAIRLMRHFGINENHFRLVVGSVPGLLISPEFGQ